MTSLIGAFIRALVWAFVRTSTVLSAVMALWFISVFVSVIWLEAVSICFVSSFTRYRRKRFISIIVMLVLEVIKISWCMVSACWISILLKCCWYVPISLLVNNLK